MQLRLSRIKLIGGIEFKMPQVKKILKALEYAIVDESKDKLVLEIPYFRTDVIVEDDIVSDILRISNYDNIPISLIDSAPPQEITPDIYHFEDKLRDIMVQLGAHEHITEPLVAGQGKSHEVVLENSLSPEKATLRTNILETLYPIVPNYFKHGKKHAFIFEVAKSFTKTGKTFTLNSYHEPRQLGAIYQDPSITIKENAEKTIKLLVTLLKSLGITTPIVKEVKGGMTINLKSHNVGELTHNTFWLNTQLLMKYSRPTTDIITGFTNHHTEDISLSVPTKPFGDTYHFIASFSPSIINVEKLEDRTDKKLGRTILLQLTFKQGSDITQIKSNLLKDLKAKYEISPRSS